jgi:hypothetical protein
MENRAAKAAVRTPFWVANTTLPLKKATDGFPPLISGPFFIFNGFADLADPQQQIAAIVPRDLFGNGGKRCFSPISMVHLM